MLCVVASKSLQHEQFHNTNVNLDFRHIICHQYFASSLTGVLHNCNFCINHGMGLLAEGSVHGSETILFIPLYSAKNDAP